MEENKDPRIVYRDIINLPHHQSADRGHMSLYDRAAQFAPYAALVGYDAMVAEQARLTDSQAVLSDEEIDLLNRKLALLIQKLDEGEHPVISVEYFIPDEYKEGGMYADFTGMVKRIDITGGEIIFFDENGISAGRSIMLPDIKEIHGETLDGLDDEAFIQ